MCDNKNSWDNPIDIFFGGDRVFVFFGAERVMGAKQQVQAYPVGPGLMASPGKDNRGPKQGSDSPRAP